MVGHSASTLGRPASHHGFDTVAVAVADAEALLQRAVAAGFNLRDLGGDRIAIALDETVTVADLRELVAVFGEVDLDALRPAPRIPDELRRTSAYLTHEVFNRYHSETEMLRYMRRLELKDQSQSFAPYAIASHSAGPMWLRDTQRALLLVAAISCSTLLALLYFGGFLG